MCGAVPWVMRQMSPAEEGQHVQGKGRARAPPCRWNVKQMSLQEDVISVTSHLCSWSKVDAVQILPAETVCSGSGAEVP